MRWLTVCAADGTPICFELVPANAPEREVAAEMLKRVDLQGCTVIADKASQARSSNRSWPTSEPASCAPTARTRPGATGRSGPVGQWIESTIWTCKGQLALERHGGRTVLGVVEF